jgi:hypothetical protein|tara:strand:+ start:1382 stop:1642 length:261 start_codon:yes stop_codon:yes gene_type:complete
MSIKEEAFTEKSLKLLADPNKLKDIKYIHREIDKLKEEIESTFKCILSDNTYSYIKKDIELRLTVEDVLNDVLNDIINRATPHQTP